MNKISSEQAKTLIEHIQQAEIVEFFQKVNDYGIIDAHLSQFQKEFMHGTYRFDFYERMQGYVNFLANTSYAKKQPKYDIFFSFSSKNQTEAEKEVQKLRKVGFTVFFSDDNIKAQIGQTFFETISDALEHSMHFVLYCTPEAMQSPWVKKEYASFYNNTFIPSEEKQRFFVLEGKDFSAEILPFLLQDLQRCASSEEIIQLLRNSLTQPQVKIEEVLKEESAAAEAEIPPKTSHQDYTQTFTIEGKSYAFEMIWVEGGTFEMGSEDEESHNDEKPVHSVTLDGFYLAKYPVTQSLYAAIAGENPSYCKACPDCPVEQVSWHDAISFLEKLEQLTGKAFRLPSEAEWEHAAKGGQKSQGYRYAGSNHLGEVAWYDENSGNTTNPVGQKKPNELGLYDMSGNVWEWCADRYSDDYYSKSPSKNPKGAKRGTRYVNRGGCWHSGLCRSAYRGCHFPTHYDANLGFRLAL